MRALLPALALAASPALAWEFTPGLPCILSHDTGAARVVLTHDPTQPLFTITVSGAGALPASDVFSIRFDGANPLTISTNRHVVTGDALTVTDTGFGNVLNGWQFNDTATALIGGLAIPFPLAGAEEPVRKFRACAFVPSA